MRFQRFSRMSDAEKDKRDNSLEISFVTASIVPIQGPNLIEFSPFSKWMKRKWRFVHFIKFLLNCLMITPATWFEYFTKLNKNLSEKWRILKDLPKKLNNSGSSNRI